MAKKGRKPKAYITSDGTTIPDLARDTDGRWRIVPTGFRFTEPDERQAVMRFRRWQQTQNPPARIGLNVADTPAADAHRLQLSLWTSGGLTLQRQPDGSMTLGSEIYEPVLWAYFREQLLKNPVRAAELAGIPQLANYGSMDIPKPSPKLEELIKLYESKSTSKKQTKASCIAAFRNLMNHSGAKTLADLTTEKLLEFRESVVNSDRAPGTIAAYFGRVKWLIAFAKKWGWDTKQLDEVLSRMSVLHAPKNTAKLDPQPIDPGDFKKLLDAVKDDPRWRAIFLLSLNLCLHIDECFGLEWEDFDLNKNVYVGRRSKTNVLRVATLWPETVEALKLIPRTHAPWVFVSKHGTRFDSKGQWKRWDAIRIAAGVPEVQFDWIRDGAYTVAMEGASDERQARVLAGHRGHGLSDNYVGRNPEFVRPAVEAVRRVYMVSDLG
jgi:integrase